MTFWWFCNNLDCEGYEGVSSSDYQDTCRECGQPLTFIEENYLTEVTSMKRAMIKEQDDG